MLPRQAEIRGFGEKFQSMDRFSTLALLRILQNTEIDTLTPQDTSSGLQDFDQTIGLYADQRNIELTSRLIEAELTRFLDPENPQENFPVINLLDRHLAALAYLCGQSTEDTSFMEWLDYTLGAFNRDRFLDIFYDGLMKRPGNSELDMNSRELLVSETLIRQMVSFGLWRAIEISKESQKVALRRRDKDRAYVGAVALDRFGQVIETAFRGEDANRSKHAENVLLDKLRATGKLAQVAIIAVSLEPCLTRSTKHHENLGHDKGCSTLLLETPVPVIAYVLTDQNDKGSGRGGDLLRQEQRILLRANHPVAIALESNLQSLPHLRNSGLAASALLGFADVS
jgi:pyrimidine deaminase RibD-like protein